MDDYESFKKQIFTLTQIDLNAYKEKQMRRRIDSLIAKHGIKSYPEYVAAIKADKDMFEEFVNYLTINVSEFYRNPEQWKVLENDILPTLMSKTSRLKIWKKNWVSTCLTGSESRQSSPTRVPFSIIMQFPL